MAEEYTPNSHKYREQQAQQTPAAPEKRTEKVVSGTVTRKQQSGLSKAGKLLMPGDAGGLKNYILMDVLVPSIKRAISDIVCNGINMLLGEPARSKDRSPGGRVSYRQYYEDRRDDRPKPRTHAVYDYDDLVFDNRGDAEEVLFRMEELVDRFQTVSVADLFDMAGVTCEYTANKYGWTDLHGAYVDRVRDGYVIRLPKAMSL